MLVQIGRFGYQKLEHIGQMEVFKTTDKVFTGTHGTAYSEYEAVLIAETNRVVCFTAGTVKECQTAANLIGKITQWRVYNSAAAADAIDRLAVIKSTKIVDMVGEVEPDFLGELPEPNLVEDL